MAPGTQCWCVLKEICSIDINIIIPLKSEKLLAYLLENDNKIKIKTSISPHRTMSLDASKVYVVVHFSVQSYLSHKIGPTPCYDILGSVTVVEQDAYVYATRLRYAGSFKNTNNLFIKPINQICLCDIALK